MTALGGRYVSVITRDGVEHLIPNETLTSERVENWTHTHSRIRLKVDVGVHYKSDLNKVIALCEEAARGTAGVLADPRPVCLLIELADSALKLQLRFWIADAQNGIQNVKTSFYSISGSCSASITSRFRTPSAICTSGQVALSSARPRVRRTTARSAAG